MQNEQLQITQTTVKLGLDSPVRFLHITDSHISLADENDSERLKTLAAARRANCFETGRADGITVRFYDQAIEYARKNELFVVYTGDLIDFMSHANFAYLDHAFDGVDYVYALGNHDICAYVGGDNEDEAYKWRNMKQKMCIRDRSYVARTDRIHGYICTMGSHGKSQARQRCLPKR